jgi:hypothetical protein
VSVIQGLEGSILKCPPGASSTPTKVKDSKCKLTLSCHELNVYALCSDINAKIIAFSNPAMAHRAHGRTA